jgi:assimilatory nitrate reductase catalytic subunit
MGPFSLTGQLNTMGGREVGGLMNMLAVHMELDNPAHVDLLSRFWESDNIANRHRFKAVDMFDEIDQGKIKAIWIIATNPVVSMPNADKIKKALSRCDLVIVSDCIEHTDTSAFSHIKSPAVGWSEKNGTYYLYRITTVRLSKL